MTRPVCALVFVFVFVFAGNCAANHGTALAAPLTPTPTSLLPAPGIASPWPEVMPPESTIDRVLDDAAQEEKAYRFEQAALGFSAAVLPTVGFIEVGCQNGSTYQGSYSGLSAIICGVIGIYAIAPVIVGVGDLVSSSTVEPIRDDWRAHHDAVALDRALANADSESARKHRHDSWGIGWTFVGLGVALMGLGVAGDTSGQVEAGFGFGGAMIVDGLWFAARGRDRPAQHAAEELHHLRTLSSDFHVQLVPTPGGASLVGSF